MKEPREESCLCLHPTPARAEINLWNYFAVQPPVRVGRATASSSGVLVVWAQQHKPLRDKIIKHCHSGSSILPWSWCWRKAFRKAKTAPEISQGFVWVHQHCIPVEIRVLPRKLQRKTRLRWKESQKHPFSTGSILFVLDPAG